MKKSVFMLFDAIKLGEIFKKERIERSILIFHMRKKGIIDVPGLRKIEEGFSYISLNRFIQLCIFYELDPIDIIKKIISCN